MERYSIRLIWSDADGAHVATCPELDDIAVVRESREDAIRDLEEMIAQTLMAYDENGWERPRPQTVSSFSGQLRLRLPRSLHERAAARSKVEGCSLNNLLVAYIAWGLGAATGQRDPAGHVADRVER